MLMKQILRYSFVALMAMFGLNVNAQEVTIDFSGSDNWGIGTDKVTEAKSYTYNGYTIKLTPSEGNYFRWYDSGNILLGKNGATLELPAFSFDVERIDVVGTSGASAAVKQNIFVGDEAVSTETAGAKDVTNQYVIAESKQAAGTIYTLKVTSNHNTQITKILIWKKGTAGEPEPETHIANTEETAYTVAKAIELIDAGKALSETVFVKGIVSQVDSYNETYKSITYWISDDGTTTNQFECYSGKGIGGADFASKDDVQVGATVIVKGLLKKYNTTYEFDKNNELVKYDDSTANIKDMKANEAQNTIFNLAGQRVVKATKGVFIQNGKKFIVK